MSEIQDLIHQIQYVYFSDTEKRYALSKQLLKLATEAEDNEALCEAYINICQCAYFCSDLDTAIKSAEKAVAIAEKYQLQEALASAHGMLAPIYTKQNIEATSIDHYHKAIFYLKKTKNYKKLSAMYSNLGAMYYNLEDYDKVLQCFETSSYYIELSKSSEGDYPAYNYHRLINCLNKALIYAKQGFYDKIKEALPLIEEHKDKDYYDSILQNINALYVKYYYGIKDYDSFYKWTDILISTAPKISYGADVLCDYFDIYDFLIELEAYTRAEALLEIINITAEEVQSDDITASCYHLQLLLYRRLNYTERAKELLPRYYSILKKLDGEMNLLPILRLKSYQKLEHEIMTRTHYQEELAILERQSAYDALTGLANRSFMNDYSESAFTRCINNKQNYGVIIIDIDHFKHYNDTYGHLAGDYCIMQVASIIKRVTQNHFSARFGGDEFFVITIGATVNEVEELCNEIQENLQALVARELGNSLYENITVSLGYYAAIPEKGQLLTDFNHSADTALYQSKSKGRNCITRYEN